MDISLIIFDLGNVIFKTDWDEPFRIWSELSGSDENKLRSRYVDDHPKFIEFELGKISDREFHSYFNRMMGLTLSFNDLAPHVRAAKESGIQAVQVKSPEETISSLASLSFQARQDE